jgi:SAM-dependent methyltransferase
MNDNRISDDFEHDFLAKGLDQQIRSCASYVLTPLFLESLRTHQPVLEAGCGSGRWMHFFKPQGIEVVGVDWSTSLRDRSRAHDPAVQFDTGDLRALPYPDGAFGAIIALGSPEHVLEGPSKIYQEFHRVIRPGGVGIITVPYLSRFRGLTYTLTAEPTRRLKRNRWLRRMAKKPPLKNGNPISYREMMAKKYRPDVCMELDFDGFFYEYQFTKAQLREELQRAAFKVDRLFAFSGEHGIVITLGSLAGRIDRQTYQIDLTWLGKLLLRLLSVDGTGHMLCAVVSK